MTELQPELAQTQNRVPGVATPRFHRFLMFSVHLSRVPTVVLAIYVEVLAFIVLAVWSIQLESLTAGFVVAAVFLIFAVVDWTALTQLPRRNRSYGPVAPTLIALTAIRAVLTIIAGLLPLGPLWIGTLVEIGNFALTGYVLDSLWGEPFRLSLTRLTLKSPKLRGAPPLRIMHLSDLHIERLTRRERKVLKWVNDLRPDLIVYTGDLINFSYLDDEQARADCREFLSQLHAPLGVYAVTGTPLIDTPDVVRAIYPAVPNVRLLSNEAIEVEGYPQVEIIGLTCTHDPTLDAPKLAHARSAVPHDKFTLLLYHAPDLMPEAVQAGIDLYVCGHTHGGQIRVPLYGAIVTSSLYGKRYEMGQYTEQGTTLYVSRGLGLEGKGAPRMRFYCPPEVELIELRGDDQ
ncbi:MAG: metallophosphoesterase [Thermoflexales bacterium]|nr:metallophosphoesterase [Thermoflexales bacterium]